VTRLQWREVNATELVEALDDSSLGDLVPSASGIYLWRRRLAAPDLCEASAEGCIEWILSTTRQPAARLSRVPLSPCVWSDGLQIGGGELSREKMSALEAVASNRRVRKLLGDYVGNLSGFTPPIYIGQTNNINTRVKQHLKGETGLYGYVANDLGLDWNDLAFYFLILSIHTDLSEDAQTLQELLEMIAQNVLAPFATKRMG